MFLSDFSIKRPTATIVLIIALMAMGLLALSKLRVNQNPDVEVPGLFVNIAYPGASPDTERTKHAAPARFNEAHSDKDFSAVIAAEMASRSVSETLSPNSFSDFSVE